MLQSNAFKYNAEWHINLQNAMDHLSRILEYKAKARAMHVHPGRGEDYILLH